MNAVVAVATESLPASRKIYRSGTLHADVRVPMLEIALHPSAQEPPLTVYDSSGPYTDTSVHIDIERGLPRLRERWIEARGDTERYAGRAVQAADNGRGVYGAPAHSPGSSAPVADAAQAARRFAHIPAPRCARGSAAVTQLAYARAGIITP